MSKRRPTKSSSNSFSSSSDFENLTDSELRQRLLQYGFPNMPVTETTRKILIKKLQNHLNNEKTKLKRQTNYITRYSSDEESDFVDSHQKSNNFNERNSNNFRSSGSIKMPPPATSTVLVRRSNVANNTNTNSNSSNYSMQSKSSLSPQSQKNSSPKIYVPPPILASESEEEADYRTYSSNSQYYNNVNPYTSQAPATMSNSYQTNLSSSSLNNMTFDRGLNNSWPSPPSPIGASSLGNNNFYTSPMAPRESNNYCTTASPQSSQGSSIGGQNSTSPSSPSYGIDFTRRLLNLRGETIRDSIMQKRNSTAANLPLRQIHHQHSNASTSFDPMDVVYRQSDSVGGSGSSSNIARFTTASSSESFNKRKLSPSTAFSRFVARVDEQYGLKQTFIPCALVSIFLLFFILVGFVYVTKSPDFLNTINEKNTNYEICRWNDHASPLATLTISCIEEDTLSGAIELLKIMVPELQKRAENYYCSDRNQQRSISAREFIKLVHNLGGRLSTDVRKTLKELHSAEYLIEKNPQWKIDHVDEQLNKINFDEVGRLRHNQGNHFAILQPRLPLTCSLYNKLHEFFMFIGTTALIVGILLGIHLAYSYVQNRRQMKIATVEYLTNEIIAELMRQAVAATTTTNDTEGSAIIVNHLRDKIIPAHKRKEKAWAWNEAIRNLELNDSRIQFDMILKNGEEFKTMKWIANVSSDVFGRSAVKQWQSPAFDKTNKIVQPPAPCLKIRQMFEPAEANNPHLKQIITDAILEKVGPKCKIYDIQLDKQTCCVYVQCASEADAGIVHNEINGWWFDKRLVSIKFLRLQRYKSRFPNSSSGTKCLQPSNSNNLSMTQCNRNFRTANGLNMGADDDDDDEDDLEDEEQ